MFKVNAKQFYLRGVKDRDTKKIVYVYNPDYLNMDTFLGKGEFSHVFKGNRYDQDNQILEEEEVAVKVINYIFD